jgi:hypothetical protein
MAMAHVGRGLIVTRRMQWFSSSARTKSVYHVCA